MKLLPFFASVLMPATVVTGCGGSTTGTNKQFDDASISSGGTGGAAPSSGGSRTTGGSRGATNITKDAGTFACGPSRCSANEICVYPPCGCIVETVPATDAGACPSGFKRFDDGGTCYLPPGCPRYPPYCTAPGGGSSYMCAGQDGTLSGIITGPIPIGSSHICYDTCV